MECDNILIDKLEFFNGCLTVVDDLFFGDSVVVVLVTFYMLWIY